ncbi:MAG TPA: hypothetical protein VGQ22_18730 [Steroidobacteraceae bacterium]|jgi:hypothetical protein|nr:hypothetical protein [Steroidobacteraceae bacterium]
MIRNGCVSFLVAVALAACGRGGAAATLDAPIQLAPGESAVFDAEHLQVKFVGIDSDSRCPSDVACVWAGEVLVRLTLRKDGRTKELGIKETQTLPVNGYSVTVLQVLPARKSSQPIPPADYRVTLKLTR